jgi:hypothetical protein
LFTVSASEDKDDIEEREEDSEELDDGLLDVDSLTTFFRLLEF